MNQTPAKGLALIGNELRRWSCLSRLGRVEVAATDRLQAGLFFTCRVSYIFLLSYLTVLKILTGCPARTRTLIRHIQYTYALLLLRVAL